MYFPYKCEMVEYVFISENRKPSTVIKDQRDLVVSLDKTLKGGN